MNERIVELNAQADKYAWEKVGKKYDGAGDLNWKWEDTKMEKFAELIVRECAHLVGGYTKENEFGTDVKEAYEEITKHFGVE